VLARIVGIVCDITVCKDPEHKSHRHISCIALTDKAFAEFRKNNLPYFYAVSKQTISCVFNPFQKYRSLAVASFTTTTGIAGDLTIQVIEHCRPWNDITHYSYYAHVHHEVRAGTYKRYEPLILHNQSEPRHADVIHDKTDNQMYIIMTTSNPLSETVTYVYRLEKDTYTHNFACVAICTTACCLPWHTILSSVKNGKLKTLRLYEPENELHNAENELQECMHSCSYSFVIDENNKPKVILFVMTSSVKVFYDTGKSYEHVFLSDQENQTEKRVTAACLLSKRMLCVSFANDSEVEIYVVNTFAENVTPSSGCISLLRKLYHKNNIKPRIMRCVDDCVVICSGDNTFWVFCLTMFDAAYEVRFGNKHVEWKLYSQDAPFGGINRGDFDDDLENYSILDFDILDIKFTKVDVMLVAQHQNNTEVVFKTTLELLECKQMGTDDNHMRPAKKPRCQH